MSSNLPDKTIVIRNKEGYNLTGPKPPPTIKEKIHHKGPVTSKKLDGDDVEPTPTVGATGIEQLRNRKGLTRSELAAKLSMHVKDLTEIESGRSVATPAVKTSVAKIKQYLSRCKTPPPPIPE